MPARTVVLPRPDTSLHDTGPDSKDLGRAKRQRALLEHWGFTPSSHLLEIGCGVGRLAYELSGYMADEGRYVGFDVKEKAVEWLNTRYAPHLPNFQFDHFDVANVRYRPGTGAGAHDIEFPYADGEFDFACSFAVFMHMQLPEIANYLNELHRVLRPGATAVLTATAITQADHDRGVMPALHLRPFVHVSDGVYAKRPDRPGIGLGYDFTLLAAVMEQAGFDVTMFVEGYWHRAEPRFRLLPSIGGDVFVLRRGDDPTDIAIDRLAGLRRATTGRLAEVRVDDAIDGVAVANRDERSDELEERLVRLRFRAGSIHRFGRSPTPVVPTEPWSSDGNAIPECRAAEVDAALIRRALDARSCIIVRQLMPADAVVDLLESFDRLFTTVDRRLEDGTHDMAPTVLPLRVQEEFGGKSRYFELSLGRVWAVDAPATCFDLMDALRATRLRSLMTTLLGDEPAFPATRLAVRRTRATVAPTWWQDSYVSGLGDLGFGVSIHLVDDGDDRPGVEVVPHAPIRILRHLHDVEHPPVGVQPEDIPGPVIRPVLQAGDALLTHPSLVRRDEPGDFTGRLSSIEALVVPTSSCPADACPVWW